MKRRDFIKTSALAAGTFALPFPTNPSAEKIKLAILGTGWWGTDILLTHALQSGLFEIVALCDVNSVSLKKASTMVTEAGNAPAKLFSSYAEMYEVDGLQAVAIATPTHWHALQFIDACKKGLHVFLEKPISYDIREGQAMLAAHQEANNVVLVDFPRVMADTNSQVKAYIESGEAGKILQVQANIHSRDAMLVEKAIPESMDYETFCGPAPKLKYLCNEKGTSPNWRGQHGFSRGIMADWGIHFLHNIREIMDLGLPNAVSAIGGITRNFTQDNPDHLDVRFDFDGLPVNWTHKSWGFTSNSPEHNIGVFYYGEKATVFSGDLGWAIYPAKGESIVHGNIQFTPWKDETKLQYEKMFLDMFTEFANGVHAKSNEGITNQMLSAQQTTACIIYGDMAYRANAGLEIDVKSMDITNHKKANKQLKRKYRSPYKHPYSG